jgi:hypothetical protein
MGIKHTPPSLPTWINLFTPNLITNQVNDILTIKNTYSKAIKFNIAGTDLVFINGAGSMGLGGYFAIDGSALSQMNSTTKGFLPPRMTTAQKNAIGTPAEGLIVYDTTLSKLCVYTGAAWETITSV